MAKERYQDFEVEFSIDKQVQIKTRFVKPDDERVKKQNEDNKKFDLLEKTLLDVLDEADQYKYQTQIGYFMRGTRNALDNKRMPAFDSILAQRWVVIRAHQLGWSRDIHENFDDWIGTGRSRCRNI